MRLRMQVSLGCALMALCSLLILGPVHAQPADSAAKHDEQARAYFRTQAYERAAEEFRKAYEIDKNPNRLFNIGLAYEKSGNQRKAKQAFEEYLQVAPTSERAVEARARKEALEAKLAELAKQQAAWRDKTAADAAAAELAAQGAALLEKGEREEAAARYQAAFEKNGDTNYIFNQAEALRVGGSTEEAISAYRSYRTKAPNGIYVGEARRRQEELEAQLNAPTDVANDIEGNGVDMGITESPSQKASSRSGAGLRLTAYVAGGIAVATFATSMYFEREFQKRQDQIANGQTEEDVGDPGNPDIAATTLAGTSFQAVAAGGLCYYMGAGDTNDSSGMLVSSCVLGGMGIGSLVFAAILGSEAVAIADDLESVDWNNESQWLERHQLDLDRGKVYETVTKVYLAAGLGSIAVGTLLYFLHDDDDGSVADTLTIVPSLEPSMAGFSVGLRF